MATYLGLYIDTKWSNCYYEILDFSSRTLSQKTDLYFQNVLKMQIGIRNYN